MVNRGDFLEEDWSDADLVFAASTCFGRPLMEKIATKAKSLKKGSWFITTDQEIPGSMELPKEGQKDNREW